MLDQKLMELPNPMIHAGTANVDNDCLYYGQAMKANETLGQDAVYDTPQGHETHQDSLVIQ
jgi:hypothetical protein